MPQIVSVQLVYKSYFTRVYGTYYYSYWDYKPTTITGGAPPCIYIYTHTHNWSPMDFHWKFPWVLLPIGDSPDGTGWHLHLRHVAKSTAGQHPDAGLEPWTYSTRQARRGPKKDDWWMAVNGYYWILMVIINGYWWILMVINGSCWVLMGIDGY